MAREGIYAKTNGSIRLYVLSRASLDVSRMLLGFTAFIYKSPFHSLGRLYSECGNTDYMAKICAIASRVPNVLLPPVVR